METRRFGTRKSPSNIPEFGRAEADGSPVTIARRLFLVCSQGERARIRVARALMSAPAILLLDEPFAGLDLPAREDLIASLEDLAATRPSLTTALVTHHLEEVPAGTTHAPLMRETHILAAGPVAEVLTAPNLSECFGRPLRLDQVDGRWHARALRH